MEKKFPPIPFLPIPITHHLVMYLIWHMHEPIRKKQLEESTRSLLWRQAFIFYLPESGHLSISTHTDLLNVLSSLPNHCINIPQFLKPFPYFRTFQVLTVKQKVLEWTCLKIHLWAHVLIFLCKSLRNGILLEALNYTLGIIIPTFSEPHWTWILLTF